MRTCQTTGWTNRRPCFGHKTGATQGQAEAARERLHRRFEETALLANADMGPAEVRVHHAFDDAGRSLLRAAMQQRPGGTRMSARAYHRILKLARTIADPSALLRTGLAGSERIETVHVAEPIHLRPAEAAGVQFV